MRTRFPLLSFLVGLTLAGCLSRPALEPVGGFEIAPTPAASVWRTLSASELRGMLEASRARLAAIRDYSAVLETRERIRDELFPLRILRVKVRHEPFSVAIVTDAPPSEAGQRVWYDESANDGELLAETPGWLGGLVGTVALDPEGGLAMKNRRHPITDTGLLRLIEQIEEGFRPALERRPSVRLLVAETTLTERPTRLVEGLVPGQGASIDLCYRLGFDVETGLLVYHGLGEVLPEGPALIEEYLYRDWSFDVGLKDEDFRPVE